MVDHSLNIIQLILKMGRFPCAQLRYYIIWKSPSMREQQRNILIDKAKWVNSIREIGPIHGCILWNELLDNFAVHRVIMQSEHGSICGICKWLYRGVTTLSQTE